MVDDQPHTLAFLLEFNDRVHWYEQGYSIKFIIARVEPTKLRPHGLQYSFTLHSPTGMRIMGFDNAHVVTGPGSNARPPAAADHWHRTETDPGRPYAFKDATVLIGDFFAEVERILTERGVPIDVVEEGFSGRRTKQ